MDPHIFPNGAQRWAILVEAGDENFELHEDVAKVKLWLQGDPFRMPDDHIQCLCSPGQVEAEASWSTKANITEALQKRLDIATGNANRKFDLVFFYFVGHGSPGGRVVDGAGVTFPPTDLTDIFDKIGLSGLILTVVMNCCFSGGLQRSETEMSKVYQGMGGLPRYNLLAACSPYQTAGAGDPGLFEGADDTGPGAQFTTYMMKALNENPRCTPKMIQRRASAANTLTPDRVLPMLKVVNGDNRSFFDIVKNKVLESIAARWVDSQTVELAAGTAHGICLNSVYAVYPWDSVSAITHWHSHIPIYPPDSLVPLADRTKIRVSNVSALTSTAKVELEGNWDVFYASTTSTTRACQAVLVHPGTTPPPSHLPAVYGILRV